MKSLKKQLMQKKIIIPTDFSDSAQIATTYGIALANALKAELIVFHVYAMPGADPLRPSYVRSGNVMDVKDLHKQYIEAIDNRLKAIGEDYNHGFNWFSVSGAQVDDIINEMEDNENSMVVMGFRGEDISEKIIYGSTAERMISNSTLPVLFVPEKVRMGDLQSVIFASDLLDKDLAPLQSIASFFEPVLSELTILHVCKDCNKDIQTIFEGYKDIVEEQIKMENKQFKLVKDEDIIEGIEKSVEQGKADMLVMNTVKRTAFFDQLFHKSISREMVLHSKVPILICKSE
jgi:nucleotide-binding universal stress UspA family protein